MPGSDGGVPYAISEAPGPPGAAIAVIDAEGSVIGWTEAAEQLLGYRASEVVNTSATDLLMFDGARPAPSALSALAGVREPWSGMVQARHQDGRTIHMSVWASPLAAADGRRDWFISAADLSETPLPSSTNEAVLKSLLDHSPIGMAVWDADLRCIWLNSTDERRVGPLRHQRLGLRVAESLPGFDTDSVEASMLQVLKDGKPVIDHEYRWAAEDGKDERVFSSSFFRLDGPGGSPLGVCSMVVDITTSAARQRLTVLSEAGTRIGTTLDVMSTAQELADVAVPLLADYVTVDLAESVPLGEEPLVRLEATDNSVPVFRRAGVTSIHAGIPESMWRRGDPVFVPPSSPFTAVLNSGKTHFEPVLDYSPGTWLDQDPGRARTIHENGMHSLMILPLKARGVILGIVVFIRTDTPASFSRDDRLLAEEIVIRAALSLDNARRYTRERTTALALQRYLLPRNPSGGSAVDVAWRYLPADVHDGVGGDWFDVIPLSGARVALVVGDVVGHGINAAATMGRLRTAVHTLADMDLPPEEVLARLDDLVARLTDEDAGPKGYAAPVMGGTCVYAVYDPVTRRCTMARAGHPPPAIVDPDGNVTFPKVPSGAPIGLGVGLLSFQPVEMELPEGSMIALYTDGLVETREADIDVGLNRLRAALTRAEGTLEEICSDVVDTVVAKAPAEDDVALLLARTRSLSTDQYVSWELSTEPAVVGKARSLAVRQLSTWGLEELSTTVELIVSELVTNAIRYSSGAIRLRLIRHKSLTCEVSDGDSNSPRLRHALSTDENGRGLFLIAELSRRWGTRIAPGGKIVWAELTLPTDSPPTPSSR
ncbi:SpoIIE family protein phosphatase [Streptomyces sp. AK02-01A]|uniref:SpoIIE family protein phosphatase n=1 Tax=Streptomyces sp. AK02-01A TaxID=3028648 RepID=UPI0029B5831C|nr:SpoIIE family protein phosphatase [Streptomyces sp. AK02-01A]MDX3853810.1 SpoIIE family protein phosphatase [Streptomyces sp. AK02-01A]